MAIRLPPSGSAYVQLAFDPAREGSDFAGDLMMEVEAFADSERVAIFSVPVSVIPAESVERLGEDRMGK
jgi:hypothetical protein